MDKAFVFGVSVDGENFTDREQETKRIRMNFEEGINTILISPRRMGKTSLIKKVGESIDGNHIKVIYIDIYDCRNEYDFYNKFAEAILKATSTRLEQIFDFAKEFIGRIVPKISISPDMNSEYSISLGLTPKNSSPEEILSLPERIAENKGIHIVVCLDEFQQIGEFHDSVTIQKRLRSVWQHQKLTSYCLFGSKKHMMEKLFQSKRMPFYQFGDTLYLNTIPTDDWIRYIKDRFATKNKTISDSLAARICEKVHNHSSYVQQLAWNVLVETEGEATENGFNNAVETLIAHNSALFLQQIEGLTSYQINFIRAICRGVHKGFGAQDILEEYNLGTKSNIARIQKVLLDKELIEKHGDMTVLADPVFQIWFTSEYL